MTADFNGDGNADFATTVGGSIQTFLGDGKGGFRQVQGLSNPVSSVSIRSAWPASTATASRMVGTEAQVFLLPGEGDGTFGPPVNPVVQDNAVSTAVGHFNSDTKLDLVVANHDSNTVSILLGNDHDGFREPSGIHISGSPWDMVAGDFNGDGHPDLAISNGGVITILIGKGDGTFERPVDYPVGFSRGNVSVAVVEGDFNGDGTLDIVSANAENISLLLGRGDGTFKPAVNLGSANFANDVVAGDFDGDGELDLAYVDNFHGTVEVILGHGYGTFANPIGSPTSSMPQRISAADLNGDGKLDVVTVDLLGGVNVLLGKGDGSFHPPVPLPSARSNNVAEIGDLNHDGKPDIAIPDYFGGSVVVFLNKGNGTFEKGVNYNAPPMPLALVFGDFNNDGHLDLATANCFSNDASVLLGKGDGTLQNPQNFPLSGLRLLRSRRGF